MSGPGSDGAPEPPAQRFGVDEVRERLLAVDRDDRDALAVSPLELGVAPDVHLLELERQLARDVVEDAACGRAEVAPLRRVERDAARRYG